MEYRRLVLTRWTRRDRLAVLTIAVTVAFFTSTVLAVTAVSTQTTAIAAEFETPASVEHVSGSAATDEGVAIPAGTIRIDGTNATLVGLSNETVQRLQASSIVVPPPPGAGVTVATDGAGRSAGNVTVVTSDGTETTVSLQTRSAGQQAIPGEWYVANETLASQVGGGAGYRIETETPTVPADGSPVLGALAFFVAGTRSLVGLLFAGAVGVAILVGVIVYSVVRMTVRDRREEIRLVRALGALPRQVLTLFGGRALLLTAVGIALGYSVGVIGVNLAANVGVFLGLPTSLSMRVSARSAMMLLQGYGIVLASGGIAGILATLPAVRGAPYADTGEDYSDGRLTRLAPAMLEPELFDWRGVVPAAGALTVFVAVLLLVSSFAGALGPLAGGDGATVTEPGATHPIASDVPGHYAGVLESQDQITASPEILGFSTVDGTAVLVRGADYEKFATVSDATLVAGRRPTTQGEAVIGADLAASLGVEPGDEVTLGGSTRPAFTSVSVVGTYEAPGYFDDHLLVSLSTARHLSTKRGDSVNFIRLSERPDASPGGDQVQVVDLGAPNRTTVGSTVTVTATVLNPTATTTERTVTFTIDGQSVDRTVSIRSFASRKVSTKFEATETGPVTVAVDDRTRTVQVLPADAVTIRGLPSVAPPGSSIRVQVVGVADGAPVAGATVTLGDETYESDENGVVTLSVPSAGTHDVQVARGDYATTQQLEATTGAQRSLVASWEVPAAASPLSQVEGRLTVSNPWNQTLSRTVLLNYPGGTRSVSVSLSPGESRTVPVSVGRLAPDSYEFTAVSDGEELATATLRVEGDARLASAIASHSATEAGTTGIGRAVATVFGNVQIIVAALVVFAGVMTVGGTTAAFARSVQARYRELGLYRAVGASRRQVLGVVVRDGLRVGSVATVLGLALGTGSVLALEQLGLLRVYGVSAPVELGVSTLGLSVVTSLALVVTGTVLAVWPALQKEPVVLVEAGDE
ncbi:FtsX-like permease family protein [Haloarchaeobius sp. TZWSO28]|uniref:FtsX-like permease family protein n=1 Tax=Haloarchaeobius sp. TZWSO28 TaxID=3446119 RepID=UPI003EC08027